MDVENRKWDIEEIAGKIGIWKCDNCGNITEEEISKRTTSSDEPMTIGGWGCHVCYKMKNKKDPKGRGRKVLQEVK